MYNYRETHASQGQRLYPVIPPHSSEVAMPMLARKVSPEDEQQARPHHHPQAGRNPRMGTAETIFSNRTDGYTYQRPHANLVQPTVTIPRTAQLQHHYPPQPRAPIRTITSYQHHPLPHNHHQHQHQRHAHQLAYHLRQDLIESEDVSYQQQQQRRFATSYQHQHHVAPHNVQSHPVPPQQSNIPMPEYPPAPVQRRQVHHIQMMAPQASEQRTTHHYNYNSIAPAQAQAQAPPPTLLRNVNTTSGTCARTLVPRPPQLMSRVSSGIGPHPPQYECNNEWLCDYCNQAVFSSYEDAAKHEEVCKNNRPQNKNFKLQLQQSSNSSNNDNNNNNNKPNDAVALLPPKDPNTSTQASLDPTTLPTRSNNMYLHNRRYLLGISDDCHWLSDLLCLIRENLEVFSATNQDISERSKKGGMKTPIQPGRMGLRCIHCAHLPSSYRAKGAVSYPHSIRIVHQSVRNWQRYHFDACNEIPQKVRQRYAALRSVRAHSGNASLQYWIDSAKSLGMMDTDHGIFFTNEPVPFQSLLAQQCSKKLDARGESVLLKEQEGQKKKKSSMDANVAAITILDKKEEDYGDESKEEKPTVVDVVKSTNEEKPLPLNKTTVLVDNDVVLEEDGSEIPDFLYLLLGQQKRCVYTDQDRNNNGKRKFRKDGYHGVECRHCMEHGGRYFPLTVATLANNNNPSNCTHSHVMKCRRCPKSIQDALAKAHNLFLEQSNELRPSWKKEFFDKVWKRIHGEEASTREIVEGDNKQVKEALNEQEDDCNVAALALSSLANCSAIKRTVESESVETSPSFSQMRSNKLPMKKRKLLDL